MRRVKRKAVKPRRAVRRRDIVYVVGAGFSGGLGYPLTKSLLIDVWDRLDTATRKDLRKVIGFHHPAFDDARRTTFPDIEQLLTEIAVNLELFDASRRVEGRFTKDELLTVREKLLTAIADWFHEIYERANQVSWLEEFTKRLGSENVAIISFNWDLVLDHKLFDDVSAAGYGLTRRLEDGPLLLKPHGSLNWYDATQVGKVKPHRRVTIFEHREEDKCIEAFLRPRAIKSGRGTRYTPLIMPPTYFKNFTDQPIFIELLKRCTDMLSTAKKLVFLGYSLPAADLHAQFILRCGFHNQVEGRLKQGGGRHRPTGRAKIEIVNPDQDAARRIEAAAGPGFSSTWIPKRIEDWIETV